MVVYSDFQRLNVPFPSKVQTGLGQLWRLILLEAAVLTILRPATNPRTNISTVQGPGLVVVEALEVKVLCRSSPPLGLDFGFAF
jgi:hypothetical protein